MLVLKRLAAATLVGFMLAGCSMISAPISDLEVTQFADRLSSQLVVEAGPLPRQLTVEAAVERAVSFNQALRAKELEAELAEAKVIAQAGSMLPEFVAQSRYYRRDRPALSRSTSSSIYTSSSEPKSLAGDVSLSWNILDFGLSLVRARQNIDKARQQQEEASRVRARIAEETRVIYWRAVALIALEAGMARLDREAKAALELSSAASRDPNLDPMVAINIQRDILAGLRELSTLHANLAGAVDQLRATIGLPHDAPMELTSPMHVGAASLPSAAAAMDVSTALRQRPEIRQHMYDLRITDDEVSALLLKLLPSLTLDRTFAGDSNAFLLHDHWISSGVKVVGNLMSLVRLPAELAAVDAQVLVHRQNALAAAATIAMQVHVARARVAVHTRAQLDARRIAKAQHELLRQVREAVAANKTGRLPLVRERLSALLAEIRAIVAHGDLDAAIAAYGTAKGEDPRGSSMPRSQ